jgi:hypothetical protein
VRSPLSSHGNPVVTGWDQPGDGERRTWRGGPTTWAPPSTRRTPAARALRRASAALPGVSHGRGHPRPAPPPFLRCLVPPHRGHAGGPERVIPVCIRVAVDRTAVKDLAEKHVDCPRLRAAGQREHQTPGDPVRPRRASPGAVVPPGACPARHVRRPVLGVSTAASVQRPIACRRSSAA